MLEPGTDSILGFTGAWFSIGVVTPEAVDLLLSEFIAGDDPNPEHVRYAAFRRYVDGNRPLLPDRAGALYRLGEVDPDRGMGQAVMADILRLPECPRSIVESALRSGGSHLVGHARRWMDKNAE